MRKETVYDVVEGNLSTRSFEARWRFDVTVARAQRSPATRQSWEKGGAGFISIMTPMPPRGITSNASEAIYPPMEHRSPTPCQMPLLHNARVTQRSAGAEGSAGPDGPPLG
ncbi:hypothetical protein EYF80_022637 [Liparis tanakae]|uniref:Uncharacterized protein n=1 Tax=Liparis tanakae TaxID=230148 RepID=A0A4Z2HMY0_9TELE|nr:hypothetical protein EYF80_022637 [Liparis tanakae]